MGAQGKFHCEEGGVDQTCIISKSDTGVVFGAKWYFTADAGESVTLPDSDYIVYGWWAYKTATGLVVDAFAGDSGASASKLTTAYNDTFNGLTGTATYAGPAVGKFAIDNRPLGTTLEAGHFTAVATLVADFDMDVEGNEDDNSISGTIDEFVANDVERPGWEVTLGATDVALTDDAVPHFSEGVVADPTADPQEGDNAANMWTIDDVDGLPSGSWSGNFYNDGAGRNDGTPELVTGTFSASHGSQGEVAHMIGAFGASNTHDDTPSN